MDINSGSDPVENDDKIQSHSVAEADTPQQVERAHPPADDTIYDARVDGGTF